MTRYRVQGPDGKVHVFEGPDGATPQEVEAFAEQTFLTSQPTVDTPVAAKPEDNRPPLMRRMQDLVGGAVRGAGSIGATLLTPYDLAVGNSKSIGNPERRNAMDQGLQSLGVDTNSLAFGTGKLGGEIAGTAGVGGVLGNAVRIVPKAAPFANALATSGMNANGMTGLTGLGVRSAGGAISGGAMAGFVNPDDAGTGALIGGVLPGATKAAGWAGNKLGKGFSGVGITPERIALADRAKELGIDIPADRLGNSKPMNALAASLDYVPFSGRSATERKMLDQMDTAVSRTFGENSSNVMKALGDANQKLGAEFDRVLKSNTVKVDKQLLDDATDVVNLAREELGDSATAIESKFKKIFDMGASGEINGRAAYTIKRELDRLGKNNSNEAYHARELKKVLLEALDRSIGPAEAAKFAQTRRQYSNMLDIENVVLNGADGDIAIAKLAGMRGINKPEMKELADIASTFLKGRESPHGALQRVVLGTGASGLAATGTMLGMPAAIPMLGATMAVGRGTNALLNSNTARNFMLQKPNALAQMLGPQAKELAYRTAPLIGGQ